MAKRKHNKKNIVSFAEAIMLICAVLIGISIYLPYAIHKHKKEQLDKEFYTNQVINGSMYAKNYTEFWKLYDITLKARADTDGNKTISVQEKTAFDKAFFEDNGMTVDPATKDITKADGTHPDPQALSCRMSNFYPDKPWIRPVCPNL